MYKITLSKKTGFRIVDPTKPVIIRDNRGILFYSTESQVPRINCFNLPGFGTYWVEGQIKPSPKPVSYPYAKLPPLKKRYESPFDFQVIWGINPNKCTIDWEGKTILFDSQFLEKPLPEVFFILCHEYGHAYFAQETLADQMGGNYMKALGFNPSQIGNAPLAALSERQVERKMNMIESIQASQ